MSTWSTRSSCEDGAGPPAAPSGQPVSAACSAASSAWETCAWPSRPSRPHKDEATPLRSPELHQRKGVCPRRDRNLWSPPSWRSRRGARERRSGGDTSQPLSRGFRGVTAFNKRLSALSSTLAIFLPPESYFCDFCCPFFSDISRGKAKKIKIEIYPSVFPLPQGKPARADMSK